MGIVYKYLDNLAQRRTFSETQRYLKSVGSIEEQRKKKEQLVNSVLPSYMADDVVEAYLEHKTEARPDAFHKFNVANHDNVR